MYNEAAPPFDIHKLYAQLNKGKNPYTKTMGQGDIAYQHTTRPELPDSMNHRSDDDCVKANYVDPKNMKTTHPWCFDKQTGRFKPQGMKPDFNYAKTAVDRLGTFSTDANGDNDFAQAAKEFAQQNGYGFQYAGGKITFTRQQPGFKEWLHLQEFSDINAMDTSHIDLQYQNGSYIYSFDFNGAPYRLEIESTKQKVLDTMLSGYIISFTAGQNFRLTNQQGAKASDVYTHIMLGIKKFLEEVQHNPMRPAEFLSFYGFEGKQDLIYDRLVRRFLTGYTRVDPKTLVRNDVLEHLQNHYGPSVTQQVQQGQAAHKDQLAQTREEERQKKLGQ